MLLHVIGYCMVYISNQSYDMSMFLSYVHLVYNPLVTCWIRIPGRGEYYPVNVCHVLFILYLYKHVKCSM